MTFKINGFNKRVQMKLTFEKTESFRIRMWIARQLILLANWLVGIETVIEDE